MIRYRVFRKNCVFSQFTATPPSPTYCCKRPLKFSTQCECTVVPIGWPFFVQPIADKNSKLLRILGKKNPASCENELLNNICMGSVAANSEKNTIFLEQPVAHYNIIFLCREFSTRIILTFRNIFFPTRMA